MFHLTSSAWYTVLTLAHSMLDYLYVPNTQPMDIEGWPTLADMIISDKRVVAMLAYDADQQKVCHYAVVDSSLAALAAHEARHIAHAEFDHTDPMVAGHMVLPMADTFLADRSILPLYSPATPGSGPRHFAKETVSCQPQS